MISQITTARAQLMAEVIAVYQSNKPCQKYQSDMQELFDIILIGTLPKIYKTMVYDELANAVKEGRFPTMKTAIYELEFDIERDMQYLMNHID